jgi:peptidoglycan/LPS O-acetylase OafA/YrhL
LSRVPGIQLGHYGVQLFFVISGFVISLTLHRCRDWKEFAVRRYSRLAPAMLVFSAVTFVALQLIPGAPFDAAVSSFIPSILLIDPYLLNKFVPGDPLSSMDGVYWSLYVEVQFYVVAATIYFVTGPHFPRTIAAVSAAAVGLSLMDVPLASAVARTLLFPNYFPWFILGIGFHLAIVLRQPAAGWTLVLVGMLQLAALAIHSADPEVLFASFAICVLFLSAFHVPPVRFVLATKPLVAVGAASYGLYLVHQYVGIALLNALPVRLFSGALWGAVAVAAVLGFCIAMSIASFRRIESPLSRLILNRLLRLASGQRPVTHAPR